MGSSYVGYDSCVCSSRYRPTLIYAGREPRWHTDGVMDSKPSFRNGAPDKETLTMALTPNPTDSGFGWFG